MSQLKWGSYSHAENEVEIASIRRQSAFNEAHVRTGILETWTIRGMLQASTQALLTTAINDLEAAYEDDGRDLNFYTDAGSTLSAHSISSSATKGGTRVVSLAYPDGKGGEYSTYRTYEIVIEAEFPLNDDLNMVQFEESLTFAGGGPKFVVLQPLNGAPIRQRVADATPFTASQDGRAVGYLRYPVIPRPFWPNDEHRERRRTTERSPQLEGFGGQRYYANYEVTWHYEFEAGFPLYAHPHLWTL